MPIRKQERVLNKILLASHGTIGAQAAEKALLKLCLTNTELTHLYVLPEFWKNMLGDDWLNNEITRERFGNYLESELAHEIDETITRLQKQLQPFDIEAKHKVVIGDPENELLKACQEGNYKLVITGSTRPKTMPGLKSRMTGKRFYKYLPIEHLQIPHPLVCA